MRTGARAQWDNRFRKGDEGGGGLILVNMVDSSCGVSLAVNRNKYYYFRLFMFFFIFQRHLGMGEKSAIVLKISRLLKFSRTSPLVSCGLPSPVLHRSVCLLLSIVLLSFVTDVYSFSPPVIVTYLILQASRDPMGLDTTGLITSVSRELL